MAALGFSSANVRAALPSATPQTVEAEKDDAVAYTPSRPARGFQLQRAPGVAVSLGAYGGLSLLESQRATDAHLVAGGIARLRFDYVELGGQLEVSDRVQEKWQLIGGFIGGYIPFQNWVDFEFAVGAGLRQYQNPDERYGAGGYDIKTPAITLRAGLSDRLGEGLFGLRVGAELLFGFDLKRQEATWTYSYTDNDDNFLVERGTTPVGGTSIGFVVNVALDVGRGSSR